MGIIIIITVWFPPFQCIAPLAKNNLQSGLSHADTGQATLKVIISKCPVSARWHLPHWGYEMMGRSSGCMRMRTSYQPFPITLRNCGKISPDISWLENSYYSSSDFKPIIIISLIITNQQQQQQKNNHNKLSCWKYVQNSPSNHSNNQYLRQ